jgi:hypothetical protein
MPLAGIEPEIPAVERPQTHALDRAATGVGTKIIRPQKACHKEKKRTTENPNSEPLRRQGGGRNEKCVMKKNAQVKVVKKKRAVFAEEGRKDECCLLRFVQKFLPPSYFPRRYPFCLVLACSFSPQTIQANRIPSQIRCLPNLMTIGRVSLLVIKTRILVI